MVIFLLLVIIAILLMGASAFIGAIGFILGAIALSAAVITVGVWVNMDPMILFIGVAASISVGRVLFLVLRPVVEEPKLRALERHLQSKGVKRASELVQNIRIRRRLSDDELKQAQMSFSSPLIHSKLPDNSPVLWLYGESQNRQMDKDLNDVKQKTS